MKIAITINTTWNIFNFRLGLIKSLQKEGHEIIAISPSDQYISKLEEHGIKHYDLPMNPQGTNPFSDLKVIYAYKKLLNTIQPDVVLSYTIKPNIYGNFAAGSLGIPVINNVSGLGTLFIKNSISSYVGKFLYYLSFKKSSWVFFQNQTDKNLFVQAKLVSQDFVSVLPGSGVNTEIFKSQRTANKGTQFLFVGRLIGDKGIREYIEAAQTLSKKYKDVVFNIVGELGYANKTAISEEELNGWLKNEQIKFLGKQDDMVSILEEADVMVLPSYREGLSRSLIEAASMELPIVTTDVPGCREVVNHGENGYLCKVCDPVDLKNKMESMINLSEKDRLRMSKKGRELVKSTFDERTVVKMYIDKINELLN